MCSRKFDRFQSSSFQFELYHRKSTPNFQWIFPFFLCFDIAFFLFLFFAVVCLINFNNISFCSKFSNLLLWNIERKHTTSTTYNKHSQSIYKLGNFLFDVVATFGNKYMFFFYCCCLVVYSEVCVNIFASCCFLLLLFIQTCFFILFWIANKK